MTKSENCTVLTGLLDFYSDRATTHASFVVAATFGLYTILFSMNGNIPKTILSIIVIVVVYSLLVLLDIYSFFNFGYYAMLANITKTELEEAKFKNLEETEKYYKALEKEVANRSSFYSFFSEKIKDNESFFARNKILIFGIVWFATVILPFIYILFFVW
jgi:hypothetical protein